MKIMDRRIFIKNSISAGCLFCISPGVLNSGKPLLLTSDNFTEAMYYEQTPRGFKCLLCPKGCTVNEKRSGYCSVRVAKNNKMVTLTYGHPCYVNEVKPESFSLYHFLPEKLMLTIGTPGCNLTCLSCPVSYVSQHNPDEVNTQNLSPEEVISTCKKKNIKTLVFGYSEPVVFYEYMLAIAKLAKQNKICTVLSSSGYILEEPLKELCKYLDAAIIEVKAFSDASYHRLCGGSIFPIFNTLKIIRESKVWLEISHKIIPGYTDNFELIADMCKWMISDGYQDVPIHFNVFKPVYRLTQTSSTPAESIQKALDIAKTSGLHYVYSDHSEIKTSTNTLCPKCKKVLINRSGDKINRTFLSNNHCNSCNTAIAGIW
jgi:pyruvate formate lyase activating enzyme